MSVIEFNSFNIATTTAKIKSFRIVNIEELKNCINGKRYALTANVLGRYNILNSFNIINSEMTIIQKDLEIIERILALACQQYGDVEEVLDEYVSNLQYDSGSFVAHDAFMKAFSQNELLFKRGNLLVFGNLKIRENLYKSLNALLKSKKKIGDFVVNTGIPIFKTGAYFVDRIDEIHSSLNTVYDAFSYVLGVKDNSSTLGKLVLEETELPDTFVDVVDYANTLVEYVGAVKNKDYTLATEKATDLGMDILSDVLTEGKIEKTAFNMGKHMGENAVYSYMEYAENPNLENLGSFIYSSTIKGGWQGATETAYDIVDDIPVLGTWMKNSYEQLSDKTGLDAVFDVQSQLVDELCGQGFNGWVDGMKLVGENIEKEMNNYKNDAVAIYNSAKDFVVNGFSSVFTHLKK